MYVLTDIEWITDKKDNLYPTQLAAIKVDEQWKAVDGFSSFIKQQNPQSCDWEMMAYTGGSEQDFIKAPDAGTVLNNFLNWLSVGDIILWWHEGADEVFKTFISRFIKIELPFRTIIIKPYVRDFLFGKAASIGGLYKLAAKRKIHTNPQYEHYSENDVKVMRALMENIEFPQHLFENPLSEKSKQPPQYHPYQYDPETGMVHKFSCGLIVGTKTIGCNDLLKARKKNYKFCLCCLKDLENALIERTLNMIKRSSYIYIYEPESQFFHRPTCNELLSAQTIMGSQNYDTAIRTGRKPCPICNPSPDDPCRTLPPEFRINRQNVLKGSLSGAVRKAVVRQEQALKDRIILSGNDSLSKEQREDLNTLTNTRFAFWAAAGYQAFHLRTCVKLAGLSNLKGFQRYKDAVKAGYTPCRLCKPSAKNDINVSLPINSKLRFYDTIENLEGLCQKEGYKYHHDRSFFCIETLVGKWKIDVSSMPLNLFHYNLVINYGDDDYHRQPKIFLSYTDVFNYIKRHDEKLMQSTGRKNTSE